MKVYSIGREDGCDIIINDNTDVISRRHATLNVTSSGKMTITDQSHNGTYVNGIRISQNVPVPVTRKDNVSFAHVARLDWNQVSKPINPMTYVFIALAAIIIIGGGIAAYTYLGHTSGDDIIPTDSLTIDNKEIDEAKVTLKAKISEATGLKSAITNSAIADTLGVAIKAAQETCDNATASKEDVVASTESLQKAIDIAKEKQKKATTASQQHPSSGKTEKPQKKTEPKQQAEVKKCGTCSKPLSECEYKGKHPAKTTSRSDR